MLLLLRLSLQLANQHFNDTPFSLNFFILMFDSPLKIKDLSALLVYLFPEF
jgi:hypothetical protein